MLENESNQTDETAEKIADRNSVPTSNFFEKPEIDTSDSNVLLFCCLKNEVIRLPYFLEYYREKGIRHFFIIDNASTDGSGDYLKKQPDVHYFHTEMSYKGSSAGRIWMQELCDHYGTEKWCLTVDVDEMLVYPAVEAMSIPDLCAYLDLEDVRGLFCIFLDMYSDRRLSDTVYAPGEPFLDVCSYFETDSYVLTPGSNPPFLGVFGGPRGKSFLEGSGRSQGPMMKKVPLVKWHEGFSYIYSTHSHRYIPLSAMTGALLHFKFFDFFTDLAAYEAKRGDRRQTADYAHYAANMDGSLKFISKLSHRYRRSTDLVELGVMRATNDFRDYCISAYSGKGPADLQRVRSLFAKPEADPPLHPSNRFTIRWISTLWPFISNAAVGEHFSDGTVLKKYANRRRFAEEARKSISLVDIEDSCVRLKIGESLVFQHLDPQLSLVAYVGEKLTQIIPLAGSSGRLHVDEGSLQAGVYRIACNLLSDMPDDVDVMEDLRLYVVLNEQLGALTDEGGGRTRLLQLLGPEIHHSPRVVVRSSATEEGLRNSGISGLIERIEDGVIIGWARDIDTGSWTNPLAVFINGRYCGSVVPDRQRPDLVKTDAKARGYEFPLPLDYFYERSETNLSVVVRPAGRNVDLRRAPARLTGGRSCRWLAATETWGEVRRK